MGIEHDFLELFDGHPHAYGTEEGGCVRLDSPRSPHSPLPWPPIIAGHLSGEAPIGIYPVHNGYCKWGCVDFDEGDEPSWVHARNLHGLLFRLGITSWIERSRSKGYHVWVFCTDWVPARDMRRALLFACQKVGAPTKEINPKSEELPEGSLGNYVRLPYPGGRPVGRRCIVSVDGGNVDGAALWVQDALRRRNTPAQITDLAKHYEPPAPTPRFTWNDTAQIGGGDMHRRLSGLAWTILQDGPIDGDRSDTLFRLASLIREGGNHSQAECRQIIDEADMRWGKFRNRRDRERRLDELVSKAWGVG